MTYIGDQNLPQARSVHGLTDLQFEYDWHVAYAGWSDETKGMFCVCRNVQNSYDIEYHTLEDEDMVYFQKTETDFPEYCEANFYHDQEQAEVVVLELNHKGAE